MSNEEFAAGELSQTAADASGIRIGIFIQHFPPKLGGAERQAELLAGELARRGNTVRVITTRHQKDLAARSDLQGVSIWRLPTVAPRWLKLPLNLAMGFYAGLMVARQLDIFHAHCLSPFALGALLAAKLARRPVLIKICSMGEEGDISRVKGFGPTTFLWPLYRLADLFIAPTPAVASELLAEGSRRDQVAIIPNLLQEQGKPETPEGRRRLRLQLGLPERATLVYVGRLHEAKGLAALMRVWPVITKKYDAQLLLVGEGPENERIKQWRSESNSMESVTLTGYQTNPAPYYRASDIFVFPSSSETFGNAIVEAMSHGLAVATTCVGVVRDWHLDAPVVRVDTNQLERFADLLSGLIEDENRRSNMGTEAADFIRGQYGVRAVCDNYQTQYQQLIKKTGIRP